ncbi:MAG: glycerol-3-phosphate dehydrogenase [Pseudomonadota bacterium]
MQTDFDLIVIGGGINGAGIARDGAMRGLRVLLLEMDDFGSGTSSWSSRLIHGGLRYLEHAEIALVYESLHDRRALFRTAAHLVRPLRLHIPIYRDARRGPWLIKLGMLAYDLLSFGKRLPSHRMLSRKQTMKSFPGLDDDGLRGAASYYDGQVEYAERLVVENILSAVAAGAVTQNYCEVTRIHIEATSVGAVHWTNRLTGQNDCASAPVVVNATGPWVDRLLDTVDGDPFARQMGGTKGSHLVLAPFDGAPTEALYVEARSDGRPFFILPWNDQILVGTTDIRDDSAPEDLVMTADEIDYLLAEFNALFPNAGVTREHVRHTYSGLRPLPHQLDGPAGAITRSHVIRHHSDVARGLYSIIGGKLTTYRSLADDCLRTIARDFDWKLTASKTHVDRLPGAVELANTAASIQRDWLGERSIEHLLRVYGSRARDVVALAEAIPPMRDSICDWSGAIAAEVPFAMRFEQAKTLEDVINRRTMIGLGPDRGVSSFDCIADLFAAEAGLSVEERDAMVAELRSTTERRFQVAA